MSKSLGFHVQVSSWRDFMKAGKKVRVTRPKLNYWVIVFFFWWDCNLNLCYLHPSGQKGRDAPPKPEDRGSKQIIRPKAGQERLISHLFCMCVCFSLYITTFSSLSETWKRDINLSQFSNAYLPFNFCIASANVFNKLWSFYISVAWCGTT